MGVPKEIFNDTSQEVVDLYNVMQLQLFIAVGEEIGKERALFLSDISSWSRKRLNEIEPLRIKSQRIIEQLTPELTKAIDRSVREASYKTLGLSEERIAELMKSGAKLNAVVPLEQSEQLLAILNTYQRRAKQTFNLTNTTMLSNVDMVYTDIINVTTSQVLLGNKTHHEALKSTVRQYTTKGIPALIDKAGRTRSLESYARTVIRTTTNTCANEMQDERYREYGIDLVEISSHTGARPKCATFQGRVFALGDHPKYPNIYNQPTYGEVDSIFGINCHHVSFPFIDGISKKTYEPLNKKENAQAYKNSQTQRLYERKIRSAKTEFAMMEKIGDNRGIEEAKALVRHRQKQMRQFIDETGRTRHYDREWVGVKQRG